MRYLLLLAFAAALLSGCRRNTQEVYLLPEGYIGRVVVYLQQQHGQPVAFEGNARVFAVPDSGALHSQHYFDEYAPDPDDIFFYYVDKNGARTRLKYRRPTGKNPGLDEDEIQVYDLRMDRKRRIYGQQYVVTAAHYTFVVDTYRNAGKYRQGS